LKGYAALPLYYHVVFSFPRLSEKRREIGLTPGLRLRPPDPACQFIAAFESNSHVTIECHRVPTPNPAEPEPKWSEPSDRFPGDAVNPSLEAW
jgi:hypothetical protein